MRVLVLTLHIAAQAFAAEPPTAIGSRNDLTGVWETAGPTGSSPFGSLSWLLKPNGEHEVSGTLRGAKVRGTARLIEDRPATGARFNLRLLGALEGNEVWAGDVAPAKDRARMSTSEGILERRAPAAGIRLKLMAYNIHGAALSFGDVTKLAKLILRERPDVLALEEVENTHGLLSQAKHLGKLTGYAHVEAASRGTRRVAVFVKPGGPHDLRILGFKNHRLPRAPDSGDGARNAIVVDIGLLDGRRFKAVAAHLSHKHEPSRLLQARYLVGLAREPMVLMGDFNTRAPYESHAILEAGLVDVFASVNPDRPGFTYPSSKPAFRIDYIFLSAGRGLAAWVRGEENKTAGGVSDHLAVCATVDLPLEQQEVRVPGYLRR